MKILLLLLLSVIGLNAQNSIYNDFSATVKGVTVGSVWCYFWFHDGVYTSAHQAGFEFESACYESGNNVDLAFKKQGQSIKDGGFTFTNGYIRYTIRPNTTDPTKWDFALSSKGPSDTTDIPEMKLTI